MGGKTSAYLLFGIWAVVYALSFIVTANTAAKDMGFTRGLNRVTTFVGWQLAATVIALAVWSYARNFEPGIWRWMFRTPAILAAALLLFVIALFGYAIVFKPQQSSTPTTTRTPTALPNQGNVQILSGYYRQGFEQSEFYTRHGDGPYWVDTTDNVASQLQAYLTPMPGRGSFATVKLDVVGQTNSGGTFGHLGAYVKRIFVERIENVEQLSPEEYDAIIQGFSSNN